MAIYSDVTRESVLAAIRECDEKGRNEFLREHGYGRSRSYPLPFEGREYDSKAVLLVACGYQHPDADPLPHDAFTGGIHTVVPHLRKLGFEVPVGSRRKDDVRKNCDSRTRKAVRVQRAARTSESDGTITLRLIKHAEQLYKRSPSSVNFSGHSKADDLLNDISGYPHAFVTAAVMDRQTPAERHCIHPRLQS